MLKLSDVNVGSIIELANGHPTNKIVILQEFKRSDISRHIPDNEVRYHTMAYFCNQSLVSDIYIYFNRESLVSYTWNIVC